MLHKNKYYFIFKCLDFYVKNVKLLTAVVCIKLPPNLVYSKII